MDTLSEALCTALATALQGDNESPMTKEELMKLSRHDIEQAVRTAMTNNDVLSTLVRPDVTDSLLLSSAGNGKRNEVVGALHLGANVNARQADTNHTPLMLAAKAASPPTVSFLIAAKADLTAIGAEGSALHMALASGCEEAALLMLDAGLDPFIEAVTDPDAGEEHAIACIEREVAAISNAAPISISVHSTLLKDRRAMCARLRSYIRGTLPPALLPRGGAGPGEVPQFYAERKWTEAAHKYCPAAYREAVLSLLLASNRRKEGDAGWLPPELWLHVLRHTHRDWFDSDELRGQRREWEERQKRLEWEEMQRSLSLLNNVAELRATSSEGFGRDTSEGALEAERLEDQRRLGMWSFGLPVASMTAEEKAEEERQIQVRTLCCELATAEEALRLYDQFAIGSHGSEANMATLAPVQRSMQVKVAKLKREIERLGGPYSRRPGAPTSSSAGPSEEQPSSSSSSSSSAPGLVGTSNNPDADSDDDSDYYECS